MTELTTDVWRVRADDFPAAGSLSEQAAFLVRYAVLAPSSHNSQPWEFEVDEGRIDLHADLSRWLRVADPDQRELHLSLGCALENILVAAERFGLAHRVDYEPNDLNSALAARIHLEPAGDGASGPRSPALFEAIVRRHTNHGTYDGEPIPDAVRSRLEALATEPGIEIRFTDDADVRRRIDDLTLEADAHQFADPEWRRELGEWLGRGVFGTGWVMSKLSRFAVSHLNLARSVGTKDRELLDSASLLGLVAVDRVDRTSSLRAGQVFQRLFLTATGAGLALQPMNQILQVPEVRADFEALLPAGWGTPQITFRLGRAEPEDHTPRRPVEEVIR